MRGVMSIQMMNANVFVIDVANTWKRNIQIVLRKFYMIKDVFWLESEQKAVRASIKRDKFKHNGGMIFIKWIVVCFVLLFAGYVNGEEVICPHCENSIEIAVIAEGRAGYWKCKKCGYYNLEGIWRCPLCGTEKNKQK